MKTAYILEQNMMNGTISLGGPRDIFLSKELAEKCQQILKEKNKDCTFPIISRIYETQIYEIEEDCKEILKDYEKNSN